LTGMLEAPNQKQLELAFKEKRCLVTRNREYFVRLTIQSFRGVIRWTFFYNICKDGMKTFLPKR